MDIFKDIEEKTALDPFEDLKKVKLILKFKYPKLLFLILTIIIAYKLFQYPIVLEKLSFLNSLGLFSFFIAGALFAFGFSAAFGVALLIALNPSNIYLASLVAGLGALTSDLLIFKTVKFSFEKEFNIIRKKPLLNNIKKKIESSLGLKLTNYLFYALSGFMIASPLPDEVGVTLLAGLTKINHKILALVSFLLNTIGIFIILFFSN